MREKLKSRFGSFVVEISAVADEEKTMKLFEWYQKWLTTIYLTFLWKKSFNAFRSNNNKCFQTTFIAFSDFWNILSHFFHFLHDFFPEKKYFKQFKITQILIWKSVK